MNILTKIFKIFGVPKILKSDNGPAFISNSFAEFSLQMGFIHHLVTPRYPASNGGVERIMKNINKVVRCAQIDDTPIEQAIRDYVTQFRATPHSMTKLTPNEMMNFKDETGFPSFKIEKSKSQIICLAYPLKIKK